MRLKQSYLSMLLVGFFLTSCSKFLDVKPVGKLIPTEVEEVENLLNNVNTLNWFFIDNNLGSYLCFLGDNLKVSENIARYDIQAQTANPERLAAHMFYHTYVNPAGGDFFWENGAYRAIGIFNNVIDEIEAMPASKKDTDYAKGVVAQAKAGRAWSYLVTGLTYGPMYDPAGNNDTKTIPYRKTGSPVAENPALSTTEELFQLILQDLDDALAAPEAVPNPSRANKAAVHALKAQVYMLKGDWANALAESDMAWTQSVAAKGGVDKLMYDLNYFEYIQQGTPSPTSPYSPELEWQLRGLEGQDQNFLRSNNRENLLYRRSAAGHFPYAYASDDFVNLFGDNDLRAELFLLRSEGYRNNTAGVADGVQLRYYRGNKTLQNQGITYPMVLLMRAEANARQNNISQALTDLNLLRKYRYSNTSDTDLPNGATLDKDALINEITKERRREQPIGSYERVFDLKRYAKHDAGKPWAKMSITHTIGSKTFTAEVNSEKFIIPIQNAIIRSNPQWGLPLNTQPYNPVFN